jgi:hypothetical protein
MNKYAGVRSETVAIGSAILAYDRRSASGTERRDPVVMLHPWYGCSRSGTLLIQLEGCGEVLRHEPTRLIYFAEQTLRFSVTQFR